MVQRRNRNVEIVLRPGLPHPQSPWTADLLLKRCWEESYRDLRFGLSIGIDFCIPVEVENTSVEGWSVVGGKHVEVSSSPFDDRTAIAAAPQSSGPVRRRLQLQDRLIWFPRDPSPNHSCLRRKAGDGDQTSFHPRAVQ